MSELAVHRQDVTKSDSDRSLYQQEFNTLANYINSVATKDFNGVSLFDGTTLNVTIDSDANTFGMNGVDLTGTTYRHRPRRTTSASISGAHKALTDVKTAISQLASDRANIGANIESLIVLQQSALDVEQQPLGRQQPDHGCGRGAGEHQLRQVQHPRADRHGDAGAGERTAAIGAQALELSSGAPRRGCPGGGRRRPGHLKKRNVRGRSQFASPRRVDGKGRRPQSAARFAEKETAAR